MSVVTFAIYLHPPIACEGEDDPAMVEVLQLCAPSNLDPRKWGESMVPKISSEHEGRYIQVWEVKDPCGS